jgi:methylenetetrahydrofolate--tRNA-(uracil-5-)-methyltransferase
MLGGLYRYLREADPDHFQPMNANFGLLDPLEEKVRGGKRKRRAAYSERALETIECWAGEHLPADRHGAGAAP